MNPHAIELLIEAEKLKTEREYKKANVYAHLMGVYVCNALAATVGNMFIAKGQKPNEYPNMPFELNDKSERQELTEEEIQRQRDLFVANYMTMQTNFNLAKKKG